MDYNFKTKANRLMKKHLISILTQWDKFSERLECQILNIDEDITMRR